MKESFMKPRETIDAGQKLISDPRWADALPLALIVAFTLVIIFG
jgi:hypothetical protein